MSGDELFDSVALEAKVKTLSAAGKRYIAVDLSPLDYIYSDTINKIIGINRSLLAESGRIVIVAPNAKVFSILILAGVDKQVKIVRSLEELNMLSQLLLENFPDIKAQLLAKEEKVAPVPEEKDEFSDLKDMLSESLTIGENLSVQDEPVKTPQVKNTEQKIISDFDDMFIQEQKPAVEKVKFEVKEEPKVEPKVEIEFDVPPEPIKQVEPIAPVAPKVETVPEIKKDIVPPTVNAPVTNDFVVSSNKKESNFSYEETKEPEKKKIDLTKVILLLIILLLILVMAGLFMGVFSPKEVSNVSDEQTRQTEQTVLSEEPVVPAPVSEPVFDEPEPTPKTEEPVAKPAPKQQTKTTPARRTTAQQQTSSDVITVSTNPSGALIFMNDDYIGRSPQTITKLPYGNLNFRAELTGFETHIWTVDFGGGRRQLTTNLQRKSETPQQAAPTQTQPTQATQAQVQQQQQQLQQQQALAAQQEAQRLAAEQAARDEAARKAAEDQAAAQQQLAQQQEAQRIAQEQAARDEAARKQQELAAQQEAQRKAAAEQAAREQAAKDEAARKAAEEAKEATIFFSSQPGNAEIFLNGELVGRTGVTQVKVKPGTHTFEFKKDALMGTWTGTLREGKNAGALIRLK